MTARARSAPAVLVAPQSDIERLSHNPATTGAWDDAEAALEWATRVAVACRWAQDVRKYIHDPTL